MFAAPSLPSPKSLGAPRPQLLRSRSLTRVYAACASTPPLREMASAPASSLYDVLGVPAGATGQEIKAAYRRLARACHPDVVAAERKGSSADEFMRIHEAYATLSDPDKRAAYNRNLGMLRGPRRAPAFTRSHSYSPSSSSSAFSGSSQPTSPSSSRFSRRSWETDQCW